MCLSLTKLWGLFVLSLTLMKASAWSLNIWCKETKPTLFLIKTLRKCSNVKRQKFFLFFPLIFPSHGSLLWPLSGKWEQTLGTFSTKLSYTKLQRSPQSTPSIALIKAVNGIKVALSTLNLTYLHSKGSNNPIEGPQLPSYPCGVIGYKGTKCHLNSPLSTLLRKKNKKKRVEE